MSKLGKCSLVLAAALALGALVFYFAGGFDSPATQGGEGPASVPSKEAAGESERYFWERAVEEARRRLDALRAPGRDAGPEAALPPPAPLETSNQDRFPDVAVPTDLPQADEENRFEIPESFLVNVYKALLRHARSDPAVSAPALRRLASRTWAYQSMWQIAHGTALMNLPPPPGPEGWKDLTFLLMDADRNADAIESLRLSGAATNHTLKNYLEIVILQALNRNPDQPVRRLQDDLEEFPRHAQFLVTNPSNRPHVLPAAIAGKIREAEEMFNRRRFGRAGFRLDEAGAIELLTEHAAPGQDIWLLIDESRRLAADKARFVQGRTEHPIGAWGEEREITSDSGLAYWIRSAAIPMTLRPGQAEFRMGPARKSFFVTADPAPPDVSWMASRRVVAGEWVSVDVRSLPPAADRMRADAIVSQENKHWPAATREGGPAMAIRIPREVLSGIADLRVRAGVRISEPYPFEVVDYPVPVNEQTRIRRPELAALVPDEKLNFQFATLADAYAAVCLMPNGEFAVWTPEVPVDTSHVPPAGRWQVPAGWPQGPVWMAWAERRGEHWVLPTIEGERVTVGPVANPPEIHHAAFYRTGVGVYTAFDAEKKRYVTSAFKKGDLAVRGIDLWPGEPYAVKVVFERGGELPLTVESTLRGLLTVNLDANGPAPVKIRVAKLIRNQPGEFAALPVHDASDADALNAQTPQGRAAAEWLRQAVLAARIEGGPAAPVPVSPWGGAWKYAAEPEGTTYTWMAFDGAGVLRAQFRSDGGAASEWIEYDLLTGGESIGELRANALQTGNGLGNLVADAIREAAQSQMSLISANDLRGNIPAGPVTLGLIERAVEDPQGRPRTLHLTGRELRECTLQILDQAAAFGSGFTAEITDPTDPTQVRILLQGVNAVWDEQVYSVTLTERQAERLSSTLGRDAWQNAESSATIQAALEKYVRRHSPLSPDERERVAVRK